MIIISRTTKRRVIKAVILLLVCVCIKIVSQHPLFIERYYSSAFYAKTSIGFRALLGWIPFSVGDIFYTVCGAVLLGWLIRFIRSVIKKRIGKIHYSKRLFQVFSTLAVVYIFFNLAWGLNYNRPGIAAQLQLNPQVYDTTDLKQIINLLITKVNDNRKLVNNRIIRKTPYKTVFEEARKSYDNTAVTYPFLEYKATSVKRSMYGRLGNFLGFLGYFNPFTGEAQLNLIMPRFLIPYVSCHEMAHQLGYASESEANFVAYLAASRSNENFFHYSAYFDLFNYANGELYQTDSVAAKNNYQHLDPLVKSDIIELREYWRKSDNLIEPMIKVFYDNYLKANQQSLGLKSYNEVTGWLIAYYKKYHFI